MRRFIGRGFAAAILLLLPLISAQTFNLGYLDLKFSDSEPLLLTSSAQDEGKHLRAHLGLSVPPRIRDQPQLTMSDHGRLHRAQFGAETFLDIDYPNPECTRFTWTTTTIPEIRDCIEFGSAHWYGGPEQKEQLWPVEKLVKQDYSYVTKEEDNMGVAERLWINSQGVYLYVVPEVPLFIDSNATGDNLLCFVAKFQQPFLQVPELLLRYSVCSLPTAQQAQLHAMTVSRTQAYPRAVPDQRMVEHPIWSTWARYKRDINETVVLQFAQEIVDNGFLNSQIEIDDFWETCYGELTFDLTKFPDPAGLSRRLKSIGFRVTLWVHPFVNFNCPSFETWRQAGYFVHDENGNVQTSWWNGLQAAIVDFTNPAAATWYINRLRALKFTSEVDSFKYDAGETSWLPKPRILSGDPALQPNSYSASYVRALDLQDLGAISEVRSGFETQDLPVFVRMVDKDSHWRIDNGLRSLVTTLLTMNMVGYSVVLPDMVGGNGYGSDVVTSELFLRWLQANVFMPSIQFSYVPWQFNDAEVTRIAQKFVDLHSQHTGDIMRALQQAVLYGEPVNRPVFYAAYSPDIEDSRMFAIDDQYMLGEKILVAPVLDEGAVTRDVYLPEGAWEDMNTGAFYFGPVWLRNYSAPLDVLPYFMRNVVSSSSSLTSSILALFLLALAALLA